MTRYRKSLEPTTPFQKAIVAGYYQGLTNLEIANSTGSTEGSVKVTASNLGLIKTTKRKNVPQAGVKPAITLAGPAWSIPDHCQPASTRRAA